MDTATKLDPRTAWPILTPPQVAALTDVPGTTLRTWARGGTIHTLPNRRGWPTIPFLGLVEAEVASALLDFLPPARVKTVLNSLRDQHGEDFALTRPHLVTDLSHTYLLEGEELTRIQDRQGAFLEVIRKELRSLRIGLDGTVEAFVPDRLNFASVDPRFNGGSLSITESRTPVASIIGSLLAGATPSAVAAEYGVPQTQVEVIEGDLEWAQAAA